ncbi:hypothetical protein K377_07927 [Streptomyces sp. PsTaAH-137]|nr:hypothetical protein K377_07927 [Streptomyces sp. PsTaAH-137]
MSDFLKLVLALVVIAIAGLGSWTQSASFRDFLRRRRAR